ncbi:unnamed protein product [Schistosoma curassoni]|uniref:Uncharacterized protein n=1 Tax=Schistosoma curassoni TaxID=6186 RepID=A0A183KRD7_9TREM|nr:unnamed protein product [Schistosoma curassoni]
MSSQQRSNGSIMVIEKIKSKKAAAPDNIPTEALNSNVEVTADILHTLFWKKNMCRRTEKKDTSSRYLRRSEQM